MVCLFCFGFLQINYKFLQMIKLPSGKSLDRAAPEIVFLKLKIFPQFLEKNRERFLFGLFASLYLK